jgi:hypothetical protein
MLPPPYAATLFFQTAKSNRENRRVLMDFVELSHEFGDSFS